LIVGDQPFEDEWAAELKKIIILEILYLTGICKVFPMIGYLSTFDSYGYFHGMSMVGSRSSNVKAMGYGCANLALDTPL